MIQFISQLHKYILALLLAFSVTANMPTFSINNLTTSINPEASILITKKEATRKNNAITTYKTLNIGLHSFEVTTEISSTRLDWETSSEVSDNYCFDIERSKDGFQFSKIGRVLVSSNPESIQSYQFIDSTPNEGLNYYRLKQVDVDGKSSYTKIKVARYESLNKVSIQAFPNPCTDYIKIVFDEVYNEDLAHVTIMGIQGKLIYNQMFALKTSTLSISLPSNQNTGLYILTVKLKGNVFREKIIVK